MSELLTTLPKDSILGFVIYTRSSPVCAYCQKAKMLLKTNFEGLPVKEIDISPGKGNDAAWLQLLKENPSTRSVPQIFMTYDVDAQSTNVRIGGADELEELCKARRKNAETT